MKLYVTIDGKEYEVKKVIMHKQVKGEKVIMATDLVGVKQFRVEYDE